MEDREIVELYLTRSETALGETQKKYGRYCRAIAGRILGNDGEAEECVNDALMGAWRSIPPHRPEDLAGFLGKITRQLAIKRWRRRNAAKRGGETAIALEELSECVGSGGDPAEEAEAGELREALDRFIASLPEREKRVFLCRYWYLDPIADIAARFGYGESRVKSMLARTRKKLRKHLIEEGVMDER